MAKTFVLGVHRHMHREVVSNFALDPYKKDDQDKYDRLHNTLASQIKTKTEAQQCIIPPGFP